MDPGLVSRDGWVVVDDSARPLFDSDDFNFTKGEESVWPWVVLRKNTQNPDLYFFGYGHEYRKALSDFVQIAGRIPLPPRFAFGSWWSRYWSYSDQELGQLVADFRSNTVPLDVLVIDMGWHPTFSNLHDVRDQSGERKGWTGYTWDSHLFPDPKLFLDDIHQEGLKVTLNLHPASGVQPWEERYPQMARAMGIDPATQRYVPFDITDKKFAQNYMDILHHPLEQQGIDFWWLDWQNGPTTALPGVSATWWLNYVHFTDQEREGKRPLLFHRWGGLGNHRYQIGFSGDTISVWDSLAFQPWFTATAANVGYAYWSHDIGGHMPGKVDPELYTRWVQFGAYSPILRTHTSNNAEAERRIWAYPEPYSDVMKEAFRKRYELQPYIYTEARRTYDTGVAFVHPLYYDWPEAAEAYTSRGEYMFGDSMLVAPVTSPADEKSQLANETVWLPKGPWIEWPTGKHLEGPVSVSRELTIREVPVYVRPGAIVPMQPPMEYTGQRPIDPLIVTVFPMASGEHSSYEMYEDSGEAEKYKLGVCAWTKLAAEQSKNLLKVTIAPVRGGYAGMIEQRGYEIRLPADWPPASVTVNGSPVAFNREKGKPGWRYEGNTLTTIVTVPVASVHSATSIEIRREGSLIARRGELDGFAGLMQRAEDAGYSLSHAGLKNTVPDSLTDLMQTGDRLTYQPETASRELGQLPSVYNQALSDIKALNEEWFAQTAKRLATNVPVDPGHQAAFDAHTSALDRAYDLVLMGK
jgi:alpha-glucosidase